MSVLSGPGELQPGRVPDAVGHVFDGDFAPRVDAQLVFGDEEPQAVDLGLEIVSAGGNEAQAMRRGKVCPDDRVAVGQAHQRSVRPPEF